MVDVSELLALTSERVGRELTRLLSGENQKNGVISEFISSRNVCIFFRQNLFITDSRFNSNPQKSRLSGLESGERQKKKIVILVLKRRDYFYSSVSPCDFAVLFSIHCKQKRH